MSTGLSIGLYKHITLRTLETLETRVLLLTVVYWCLLSARLCVCEAHSLTLSADMNLANLLHLTFLYYFYALCDALRPILLSSKEMDIWKLR